jgi:hypothetical protein
MLMQIGFSPAEYWLLYEDSKTRVTVILNTSEVQEINQPNKG